MFRHELRWARTIRALVPLPYAASILQISLFWALLALVSAGGAPLAWLLFFVVLMARFMAVRRIDAMLGLAKAGDAWLILVRDLCSVIIYIASFAGNKVDWRGQTMRADAGKPHLN